MKSEQLENLNEIRNLMEKSSRFLSLSGLSGVSAGIIALVGAAVAFFYLDFDQRYFDINRYFYNGMHQRLQQQIGFLVLDAVIVLLMALSAGVYFTTRKAKRKNLQVWDNTAKRMLVNLFIPLTAGGIFCLILLYHHVFFLVAPATLIFYGLSLLNASKYTLPDIRYLGICEIVLGLAGSFFVGYGLIIWAIGFGVLHIVYGTAMYMKYEREMVVNK
ncbi:MAG: hypothetical protein JXB00_19580 [Bacteroidales bacterium]|nr:hypothetical protein [Bacteroidales bacterium]